ncbi:MAG: hypothetical protein K2O29_06865, partial [Ruminococcus sp.]|nr:hypothetical protein [Ruminococcus sp.]
SIAIMTIMSNKYYNMFLEKNFWIYMGIYVVLSIFTLSRMSGKVKKNVRGMNNSPNTIRILSRQRYHDEKREEASTYLLFLKGLIGGLL